LMWHSSNQQTQTFWPSRHALVPHTCNLSCLGGWDWEDWGSRPAQANSSQDFISKITRAKQARGIAKVVEYLLCKSEALSSNSSSTKKRKKNILTFSSLPSRWTFQVKAAQSSFNELCLSARDTVQGRTCSGPEQTRSGRCFWMSLPWREVTGESSEHRWEAPSPVKNSTHCPRRALSHFTSSNLFQFILL
jgi:hypothetical protein